MGSAIIAQLNGSSALLRSYWALCSYTSTYCQRGAACWVQGSSCNLTLLQMLLCACIRVLFFFFFYNISSVSSKLLSIVPQQFLPHSDRKWQKRHGSCQERNTSEHLFTCPLPAARCMMGNRTDKRGQSVNRRNQAKVLVSLLQIWSLSEPLRLLLMVCHVENLSNWTQLVNSRAHWA